MDRSDAKGEERIMTVPPLSPTSAMWKSGIIYERLW